MLTAAQARNRADIINVFNVIDNEIMRQAMTGEYKMEIVTDQVSPLLLIHHYEELGFNVQHYEAQQRFVISWPKVRGDNGNS